MKHYTEQEKREHWNKEKAKGKGWFICKHGLLRWGLPMFVIMMAYLQFFTPNPDLFVNALILIIISPCVAAVYGYVVWNALEKKYG